jgi:hypothetical protein
MMGGLWPTQMTKFFGNKKWCSTFSIGGLEHQLGKDYHGTHSDVVVSGFYHGFKCNEIFGASRKNLILSTLLLLLLELQKHEAIGVKFLTLILGKIVSMLLSHGAILRVLSRVAQHILGQHVAQFGWEGAVQLSEQFRTEFAKLLDCLVIFNKQHIYSAASGVTVDVNKIQQLKSRCRATGFAVSFYDGF